MGWYHQPAISWFPKRHQKNQSSFEASSRLQPGLRFIKSTSSIHSQALKKEKTHGINWVCLLIQASPKNNYLAKFKYPSRN